MKLLLNLLYFVFILFAYFYIASFSVSASTIFQDNFDTDTNSAFPVGWSLINEANSNLCNANWIVNNGALNISINNQYSCTTNITPNDSIWGPLLNNYTYEMDAQFINGTDHNIVFRYIPSSGNLYEMHFQSPNDFVLGLPNYTLNFSSPGSYPNGKTYHIKTVINDKNIKIFINGTLVRDITLQDELAPGKIALRAGTGDDPNSSAVFDNILVTTNNGTPTPTPLPVTYFGQNDSHWGSTEYDHAQSLGFSPYTMSRWGCAVTSAAMVLNYYGMTTTNPGTLNQWLNANNGYLTGKDSNGNYSYLDWTSLGKFARQAKIANNTSPDIMVQIISKPTQSSFSNIFASDFAQQIPDIVQTYNASTSSHFVVVTGKDTNSYTINDPYWNFPDLTSFNNNVDEVVELTPSHTNLSYITLVVDPTVNILTTNAIGQREGNNGSQTFSEIPNAVYGIENPIGSPTDKTSLGIGVNRLLLPQPGNGTYNIQLFAKTAQTYTLNISTLQSDGTSQVKTITGAIGPQDPQTLSLKYSSSSASTTIQNITIQSTINDVANLYQLKLINFGIYTALNATLQSALNDQKMHLLTAEKTIIKADDAIILQQKNSGGITQNTYNILHTDFLALEL